MTVASHLKPIRPQASAIYCGQQLFSDFEEHIMAIPAAKLKEILTADEAALVKASRGPGLAKLSAAELKKHAALARKQYDKWLALGREQSRAKSKKVGFGETAANTKLKKEAFADALQAFETQLVQTDTSAASKKKVLTKKKRNAGHRATRSEVRQGIKEIKIELKEPARKAAKKKAAKKVTAKKAADSAEAPTKKVKKATKKSAPKTPPVGNPGLGFDKSKARSAKTAAKQSRLDRSGVTSRVRGHVSARGKRVQGKRDSRG
jgi:flagellar hook-length control protein FliK